MGSHLGAASQIGKRGEIFEEPTGWQKVDRQIQEVRERLDSANSEEQFQVVGLLCREALISAAQEVFEAALHPIADGVKASDTDAKRMLEAIFEAGLKEAARMKKHEGMLKRPCVSRWRFSINETAEFMMAALCAEATLSVVNLLAIVAGRRGRSLG